jgi:glycosyltransferase involved in cell wall biosynthesis
MVQETVSLIMATHNRGDIIHHAIESVLWQTYPNWELIIVTDGCVDNTHKILKKYSNKRIRVFKKEKFPYYTDVRNFGISKSTGSLLGYHDDDHILAKTYLEELVKPHKTPDVVLTYCGRKDFKGVNLTAVTLDKIVCSPPTLEPPMEFHAGKESLTGRIDAGDLIHKKSVFKGDFRGFRPSKKELDYPGYCSDAKLIDDIEKNNPQGKFVLVSKRLSYYFLEHGSRTENMTTRKIKGREEGKMIDEKRWEW